MLSMFVQCFLEPKVWFSQTFCLVSRLESEQSQTDNGTMLDSFYGIASIILDPNILSAIASCLGTLMCLDAATSKCPLERSFGHFSKPLFIWSLY